VPNLKDYICGGVNIMLKKLTPNIMVEDVSKTVDFYKNMLVCFELVDYESIKGKLQWALLRCGDVQIMFESKESMVNSIPMLRDGNSVGAVTIYIELEGIKELYKMVKDKVSVVVGLHDTTYGMREFLIQDCNGLVITFAEWVGVKGFFESFVYHKELIH